MLINEFKPQRTTDARLDGRVCVVTGANSGVGLETAKWLARGGAHVVMVCRNPERGRAAQQQVQNYTDQPVDLVLGDLSVMAQVRRTAATLLERYPRIHVLINNAGLHSTKRTVTEDGYETCFAVNHLAPFLLTELLLQRLIDSAPARVIHVSSQGHRFAPVDLDDLHWDKRPYRGLKAYGASKSANLLYTWALSERLHGTGVTVNAVHPGSVRTNIGSNNGWLWKLQNELMKRFVLQDVGVAGNALYYHAASPEMAEQSGRFYNLTLPEKPHWHARPARTKDQGRTLWLLSERMTGLATRTTPSTPQAEAARA